MKLSLTLAQRLPVYLALSAKGAWGGSADILLAQDDIYRCLELAWFEDKGKVNILEMDPLPMEFDVPDGAIELLRHLYAAPGQSRIVGQLSVGVLRRLNAS